ncbi:uncharacterized protein LOC141572763 isoform X1 [Rhinolophus sinicus]|uniref:uncharacterized protein LOC141572763 isoform X1 n=1 Tax=Rhinolophus sinicus TaxID=89399 RepID=UPI003D7B2E96
MNLRIAPSHGALSSVLAGVPHGCYCCFAAFCRQALAHLNLHDLKGRTWDVCKQKPPTHLVPGVASLVDLEPGTAGALMRVLWRCRGVATGLGCWRKRSCLHVVEPPGKGLEEPGVFQGTAQSVRGRIDRRSGPHRCAPSTSGHS